MSVSEPGAGGWTKGARFGGMGAGMEKDGVERKYLVKFRVCGRCSRFKKYYKQYRSHTKRRLLLNFSHKLPTRVLVGLLKADLLE
jgi:hypothetical protein